MQNTIWHHHSSYVVLIVRIRLKLNQNVMCEVPLLAIGHMEIQDAILQYLQLSTDTEIHPILGQNY